jgi:thiamine-phosphate diphosphorylase
MLRQRRRRSPWPNRRRARSGYEYACLVVALCAGSGVTCIVNDRVDIAVAAGAGGTPVGRDDLPVEAVRRVAGPGHLIGGTARDPETAVRLVAAGADYLGVGPAYATSTKSGLPAPLGPAGVGAVARAARVPVIAIGGVTGARILDLVASGAGTAPGNRRPVHVRIEPDHRRERPTPQTAQAARRTPDLRRSRAAVDRRRTIVTIAGSGGTNPSDVHQQPGGNEQYGQGERRLATTRVSGADRSC